MWATYNPDLRPPGKTAWAGQLLQPTRLKGAEYDRGLPGPEHQHGMENITMRPYCDQMRVSAVASGG